MSIVLDGTAGVTTPGLSSTSNATVTGTLGVTGAATFSTGAFQAVEGAFTGVQVGTGSAGNIGWILGNASNQLAGIWSTGVTPSATNYFIRGDNGITLYLNASANVVTRIGNVGVTNVASTGLTVTGNCTVSGILGTGSTSATGVAAADITLASGASLRSTYSGSSYKLIRFDLAYRVELGGSGDLMPAVPRVTIGNINIGQAAMDGSLIVDSTNNRLVYYSGGNRYYIAGTAF